MYFEIPIIDVVLQGGAPSPFDRILGIRFATLAVEFIIKNIKENITMAGEKVRESDE